MVKENDVIAIIIIVLFIVLALIAFGIYRLVHMARSQGTITEESESSRSSDLADRSEMPSMLSRAVVAVGGRCKGGRYCLFIVFTSARPSPLPSPPIGVSYQEVLTVTGLDTLTHGRVPFPALLMRHPRV
ncbi:hypothetical protein F5B20DRAFT_582725 [Whalleya microplaca]|nr:hypothetical protein F5B20DRAFT_582725 [Whalleya microplaca]